MTRHDWLTQQDYYDDETIRLVHGCAWGALLSVAMWVVIFVGWWWFTR